MRRLLAACAIGSGMLLASVALARPGIIVTNDGRRLEGEITEKPDNYTVNIHGVDMTLARSDISSVTYPDAYNKEFNDRFAKLAANDVNGRIALAREAFDRRQYGLAREALDSAMKIDPNNREAADLQNTVASQMRMEQNNAGTPENKNMPTPPPNPTGTDRRLLDANAINYMRQQELQPTDRMNVQFLNNVEKRFMKLRNLQFNDFNALKPVDKALKIMAEGDETMRGDVKIMGDPASIVDYRRIIQPVVMNGCAGANCHGGPKGGDFILYSPADNDSIVYTDLLILMRYQKKVTDSQPAGVFTSPQRLMIDRGQGARSLLAQLGLPADVSEIDHPKVQGYDFVFQNTQDLRYKQVLDWMDKSLKQPPPDYSAIRYDAPIAPGAEPTAPAQGNTPPVNPAAQRNNAPAQQQAQPQQQQPQQQPQQQQQAAPAQQPVQTPQGATRAPSQPR